MHQIAPRESEIEHYFVESVEAAGGYTRKCKWIAKRGAPDRLVALFGWFGFAEIKAPGKKLQPHQEREIDRMKKAGIDVWVIDSFELVDQMIARKRIWAKG